LVDVHAGGQCAGTDAGLIGHSDGGAEVAGISSGLRGLAWQPVGYHRLCRWPT
jgi:hypothetical protein